MDELWNMWVWVAFAVPVLFALDCVLDVFFIDRCVYRSPLHASIITGLFSGAILVILLPGYKSFQLPDFQILFLAVANGVIYLLYIYFYFKALFKLNDAANLETFLGFSVFLVPVLGFLVLNEQFTQKHFNEKSWHRRLGRVSQRSIADPIHVGKSSPHLCRSMLSGGGGCVIF